MTKLYIALKSFGTGFETVDSVDIHPMEDLARAEEEAQYIAEEYPDSTVTIFELVPVSDVVHEMKIVPRAKKAVKK